MLIKGLLICLGIIGLFIGIGLLLKAVNIRKDRRWFQIHYIILTIPYAIAVCIGYQQLLSFITRFLLNADFQNLLLIMFPMNNYSLSFMLLIITSSNILILFGEVILLAVCRPIIRRFRKTRQPSLHALHWIVVDQFYNLNKKPVTLRKEAFVISIWVRRFRYILAALFFFELLTGFLILFLNAPVKISAFSTEVLKYIYLVPALSYILLSEADYFLSGDSEVFHHDKLDNTDLPTQKIKAYEALIKIYQKLFPQTLLTVYHKNQGIQKPLYNDATEEQMRACKDKKTLKYLLEQVKGTGTLLQSAAVDTLVDMINKEQRIIHETIQGEFAPYFFYYCNYLLSTGGKLLFVTSNSERTEALRNLLLQAFREINGISAIWSVWIPGGNGAIQAGQRYIPDIIVCSVDYLLDKELLDVHPEFFAGLRGIVVDDIEEIVSDLQFVRNTLSDRLTDRKDSAQILIFSGKNREIETSLENSVPIEFKSIRPSSPAGERDLMIWKLETRPDYQNVFGFVANYDLGPAYPIAVVAAKYGISDIKMITEAEIPENTYSEVLYEYDKSIRKYIDDDSVDPRYLINNKGFSLSSNNTSFILLYDTNNNLVQTLDPWINSGGEAYSMVHLFAAPYLLRDLMIARLEFFLKNPTYVSAITPRKIESKTWAYSVLIQMYESGIPEDEFLKITDEQNISEDKVADRLKTLLQIVFSENQEFTEDKNFNIANVFTSLRIPQFFPNDIDGTFNTKTIIKLTDVHYYQKVFEKFNRVMIQDANDTIPQPLPIPVSDVHNYYLPNQIVAYRSKAYVVREMNNGFVVLSQTTPAAIPQYAGCIHFRLSEQFEIIEHKEYITQLKIDLIRADANRQITDYAEMLNGNDYSVSTNVTFNHMAQPIYDSIPNTDILRLRLNPETLSPGITILFTVMLNELMKTFFPHKYKVLFACCTYSSEWFSSLSENEQKIIRTLPEVHIESGDYAGGKNPDDAVLEETLAGDAPDDSDRIQVCPEIMVIEYSTGEYGLVRALLDSFDRILDVMIVYLRWALSDPEAASFLRFGMPEYPSFLDLKGLESFLLSFRAVPFDLDAKKADDMEVEGMGVCSFCGQKIQLTCTRLSDDRIMCTNCSQHQLSDKSELFELYEESKSFLCRHYNITFDADITVKVKSATAIKKKTNYSGDGRIVGFYQHSKGELWIEGGGPKIATQSTILHELTHCWQHCNLDDSQMKLDVIEGHSKFVEIECMRLLKQGQYANLLEEELKGRDDEYSRGYKLISDLMQGEERNVFEVVKGL